MLDLTACGSCAPSNDGFHALTLGPYNNLNMLTGYPRIELDHPVEDTIYWGEPELIGKMQAQKLEEMRNRGPEISSLIDVSVGSLIAAALGAYNRPRSERDWGSVTHIVVFGSERPARAEEAAHCWRHVRQHEGWCKIIVTGTAYEARLYRSVLLRHGVPEEALLLDDKADSTRANIVNAGDLLTADMLLAPPPIDGRWVVLAESDLFHLLRISPWLRRRLMDINPNIVMFGTHARGSDQSDLATLGFGLGELRKGLYDWSKTRQRSAESTTYRLVACEFATGACHGCAET
jgi:uncharacterized SAM-binding protein YcdF (DUF218 family)